MMKRVRALCPLLVLLLLLVACRQEQAPGPGAAPSPTASAIALQYSGPLLPGVAAEAPVDVCGEGSECSQNPALRLTLTIEPDKLVAVEVEGVSVGMPAGYSPLVVGDEILISATSPDALGAFVFRLRPLDETALPALLERFPALDPSATTTGTALPVQTAAYRGQWMPRDDYGAVALLQNPAGAYLFVEAAADAAFWPQFQPLFEAMLQALSF